MTMAQEMKSRAEVSAAGTFVGRLWARDWGFPLGGSEGQLFFEGCQDLAGASRLRVATLVFRHSSAT